MHESECYLSFSLYYYQKDFVGSFLELPSMSTALVVRMTVIWIIVTVNT